MKTTKKTFYTHKEISGTMDFNGENGEVFTAHLHPGIVQNRKVGIFVADGQAFIDAVENSKLFANKMVKSDDKQESVKHSDQPHNNLSHTPVVAANPIGLSDEQIVKINNVKIVSPEAIKMIRENIDSVCDKILNLKKESKKSEKKTEKPKAEIKKPAKVKTEEPIQENPPA